MNRTLRLLLLRWHRRIGVVIALIVLMLVVTGIALNHSDGLALDKKAVRSEAVLSLYGIDVPPVTSFPAGPHWLSHLGSDRLFLDDREVAYCEQPFSGAVKRGAVIAAVCAGQLLLLDADGEIIERLGAVYGLPEAVDGIAVRGGEVVLRAAGQAYRAELDSLQFTPLPAPAAEIDWVRPQPPPPALRDRLLSGHLGSAIDWERVLLDLHSGRLFGRWGVWIVDAVAVCLLLLALSGAWVWLTKPGRFRRPR